MTPHRVLAQIFAKLNMVSKRHSHKHLLFEFSYFLRGIITFENIHEGTKQDVQHSAVVFAAWQTQTQED